MKRSSLRTAGRSVSGWLSELQRTSIRLARFRNLLALVRDHEANPGRVDMTVRALAIQLLTGAMATHDDMTAAGIGDEKWTASLIENLVERQTAERYTPGAHLWCIGELAAGPLVRLATKLGPSRGLKGSLAEFKNKVRFSLEDPNEQARRDALVVVAALGSRAAGVADSVKQLAESGDGLVHRTAAAVLPLIAGSSPPPGRSTAIVSPALKPKSPSAPTPIPVRTGVMCFGCLESIPDDAMNAPPLLFGPRNLPNPIAGNPMKCARCRTWICNACAVRAAGHLGIPYPMLVAGIGVGAIQHQGCGGLFEN